jgi:hypothetical protein
MSAPIQQGDQRENQTPTGDAAVDSILAPLIKTTEGPHDNPAPTEKDPVLGGAGTDLSPVLAGTGSILNQAGGWHGGQKYIGASGWSTIPRGRK